MTTITVPARPVDRERPLPAPPQQKRLRRLVTGPESDPRWVRPALIVVLATTAVLYLWGLGASGWANSFYSAAVQAGATSWKAFFFGSSDAANFITVDKPPAALWVMDLSARLFGVNAWSILVPQALEGVAAVGVLYAAVRRWFGAGAGLLAGAVLALTPVAALMFRFNNPDALLVLLLTIAAYAMVRSIETAQTRWLVVAGSLIGLGFLTKMLQAFLVVPAFALVYLFAAPTPLRRRLGQLAVAGLALIASSFWWVIAVQVVPAADRPYIGGSQNNSLWNLIFGYNGFGRITGSESGSVGGGGTAGSRWGATGLLRLFNADFGGQISWLLPAALILLAAGLIITRRAGRTDHVRAAFVLWGGWLVCTAIVLSLGEGIIHPYYTVALAPAIGALVGIGTATLWARRDSWAARAVLAATLIVTAAWSYVLLDRTPNWLPWLRDVQLLGALAIAGLIVCWTHHSGRLSAAVAAGALVLGLAGPAAYTLSTVSTTHSGAIPSAGPAVAGGFGPGGAGPGGAHGGAGNRRSLSATGGVQGFGPGPGGAAPAGGPVGALSGGQASSFGANQTGGFGLGQGGPGGSNGGGGAGGGGRGGAGGGGAIGGLLNSSTPTAALTDALEADSSHYTWVAATVDSNQAAGYQLATSKPVMAIGGFNGTDPAPSLATFERYAAQGRIHYFIGGGNAPAGGGGAAGAPTGTTATTTTVATQITSWVESHFTATTIGGTTLYNLTTPAAS